MTSNSTQAYCYLAHDVVHNIYYHICQYVTLGLSCGAVIPLLQMVCLRLPRYSFNPNTKCVLQFHFSMALVLVLNCVVSFGMHVRAIWTEKTNCDLLVDSTLYRILQLVGLAGVVGPMLTTHAISVERLFALLLAGYYEYTSLWVGVGLVCLVILGDGGIVFAVFTNEDFKQPSYSFFIFPETSGARMTLLCWVLLFTNSINLALNAFLIKMNQFLKNKWRDHPLSTRFQLEENILTTKFSTFISFCQVATFFVYLIITLLIRVQGHHIFTNLYVQVFRGIYLSMPIHNLAIPILAQWYLKKLYGKKRQKSDAEIALAYTGDDGQRNHEQITMRIWSTVTPQVRPL